MIIIIWNYCYYDYERKIYLQWPYSIEPKTNINV